MAGCSGLHTICFSHRRQSAAALAASTPNALGPCSIAHMPSPMHAATSLPHGDRTASDQQCRRCVWSSHPWTPCLDAFPVHPCSCCRGTWLTGRGCWMPSMRSSSSMCPAGQTCSLRQLRPSSPSPQNHVWLFWAPRPPYLKTAARTSSCTRHST